MATCRHRTSVAIQTNMLLQHKHSGPGCTHVYIYNRNFPTKVATEQQCRFLQEPLPPVFQQVTGANTAFKPQRPSPKLPPNSLQTCDCTWYAYTSVSSMQGGLVRMRQVPHCRDTCYASVTLLLLTTCVLHALPMSSHRSYIPPRVEPRPHSPRACVCFIQ